MLTATVYFTVVGFAYLLASDVSLALGIGPFLYPWVVGIMAAYGISLTTGGPYAPNAEGFMSFGAYFGILLMILYTGRHYYGQVFRRAVLIPATGSPAPESVWGARVCLVCATLFTVYLIAAGLDWPLAVMYTGMIFMFYLAIGRVSAETGAIIVDPPWPPGVAIWGIFGAQALGSRQVLIMLLLVAVLAMDPREALMPFVVNAFKVLDLRRVKVRRPAAWSVVALLIGLAVAIPVTLAFQYDRGVNWANYWTLVQAPQMAFTGTMRVQLRLSAQGTLAEAEATTGWRRLLKMSPAPSSVIGFGVGLALVLAFAVTRLRLPKWPLHPVLFLVWSSYPGKWLAASFLLGWAIKVLVTKYGGVSLYQRLKPLMFGLIAGEMLGGLTPIMVGLVYWLATGQLPKVFNVLPT